MLVEKLLADVYAGMYIVKISDPEDKFKLAKAGVIKDKKIIDAFYQKGIKRLLIDLSKSEIQNSSDKNFFFKKEIIKAKSVFYESKNIQKKIFYDAENGNSIDLASVNKVTDESIELIFNNPDALICVLNLRNKDEYLLEHSVSVSVLITIFAFFLKMDKETVRKISVGAFLHDIGKIKIPESILNKPAKLTDKEFTIMKTHASHSVAFIKDTPGLDPLSLEVAALHHEKLNGEGYPNGLYGEEISIYGRMVAICDIYDALTANRCYKEGFSQVKAFSILRNLSKGGQLDKKLVDQFILCMGVYPVGSIVLLDSNQLAMVTDRNKDDPVQPHVETFYNLSEHNFESSEYIDLANNKDNQIIKCVRVDDYDLDMGKIVEYLTHVA